MVREISDVMLIHPSVVINGDQTEFGRFINDILSHSFYQNTVILLESPNNFLKSNPLSKRYQELVDKIIMLSELYKERFFMVAGESIYSCARVLINEKKNVCFVGFPYPELRSLYQYIIASKATGCSFVICDFKKKYRSTPTDFIKDGKMAPDLSKIKMDYVPVVDLNNLKCREEFSRIEPYKDAMPPDSYLYIYEAGTQKMILKSIKRPARDYIAKIEDLIDLRKVFIDFAKEEALPQKVVYDGKTARGVVFNYIEGSSLDNLYYDNYYQKFMEKNGFKTDLVNRIYILIQLYATISEYHSMGIYLSDIKGDNFIVTKNCRIIPIDSDGFSYYKYYSSCPRQEMMYTPEKDHKRAFLQNRDIEQYAVMTMTYCFLMNGNSPFEKEGVSLKDISDAPNRIFKTERGRQLVERWRQFPKYLQDVLYYGLVENRVYDDRTLLALFLKYFMELTHESTEELQEWVEKKVQLQTLIESRTATPINLFDTIVAKKKYNSSSISKSQNKDNKKSTSTDKCNKVNNSNQKEGNSSKSNVNNNSNRFIATDIIIKGNELSKNRGASGTKNYKTPVDSDEANSIIISALKDTAKAVLYFFGILLGIVSLLLLCFPEMQEKAADYFSAIVLELEAEIAEIRFNYSINDDYSAVRDDVGLTTSKERIDAKVGKEIAIRVGVEGNCPDKIGYGFVAIDGVELSWGEREDDDSVLLSVIGSEKGVYILRLYLYDRTGDEKLIIAYKDICVNIY